MIVTIRTFVTSAVFLSVTAALVVAARGDELVRADGLLRLASLFGLSAATAAVALFGDGRVNGAVGRAFNPVDAAAVVPVVVFDAVR